eukprot:1159121-Pelagomonas_calceolata.AAC.1
MSALTRHRDQQVFTHVLLSLPSSSKGWRVCIALHVPNKSSCFRAAPNIYKDHKRLQMALDAGAANLNILRDRLICNKFLALKSKDFGLFTFPVLLHMMCFLRVKPKLGGVLHVMGRQGGSKDEHGPCACQGEGEGEHGPVLVKVGVRMSMDPVHANL